MCFFGVLVSYRVQTIALGVSNRGDFIWGIITQAMKELKE